MSYSLPAVTGKLCGVLVKSALWKEAILVPYPTAYMKKLVSPLVWSCTVTVMLPSAGASQRYHREVARAALVVQTPLA